MGVFGDGIDFEPLWFLAALGLVPLTALLLTSFGAALARKGSRKVRGWRRQVCRAGLAVTGLVFLAMVACCAGAM
jgi:hypothetical protein